MNATGGGTLAAGVVTWNIGALNAGSSGSVQLVVAVASPLANGTVITNGTYGIDSNETAPVAGASVTTTVSSAPILAISKTDAPDPVVAGGSITYTINYDNTGNANASGVVITDTIPANTSFVSATGGGNLVLFYQSSGLEHPQTRPEGWDQSGSIRRPYKHLNFHPEVRFAKMIEVPIVTLDAWADMHGINHVDFIWADVQGAESDLVQGASRILGSTRYFYTENSNVEMYEGQVDLATLAAMLPDFAVVRRYQWDVLFRNRRYG